MKNLRRWRADFELLRAGRRDDFDRGIAEILQTQNQLRVAFFIRATRVVRVNRYAQLMREPVIAQPQFHFGLIEHAERTRVQAAAEQRADPGFRKSFRRRLPDLTVLPIKRLARGGLILGIPGLRDEIVQNIFRRKRRARGIREIGRNDVPFRRAGQAERARAFDEKLSVQCGQFNLLRAELIRVMRIGFGDLAFEIKHERRRARRFHIHLQIRAIGLRVLRFFQRGVDR